MKESTAHVLLLFDIVLAVFVFFRVLIDFDYSGYYMYDGGRLVGMMIGLLLFFGIPAYLLLRAAKEAKQKEQHIIQSQSYQQVSQPSLLHAKFCVNCGAEIKLNEKFCTNCGNARYS